MVFATMHTAHDQLAKQVIQAALAGRGTIEKDAEVHANVRRIDLVFTPRTDATSALPNIGLLGRITSEPVIFEFFRRPPSADDLLTCIAKHRDYLHSLLSSSDPLKRTWQWIISAGRPDAAINELWMSPRPTEPGIYDTSPLIATSLVVVNELPFTRDTVLVRLLGNESAQDRAIAELKALPRTAVERQIAAPVLRHLRHHFSRKLPNIDEHQEVPMTEIERFFEVTQELYDAETQRLREEGGQVALTSVFFSLYETRFGAVPDDVRAIVQGVQDVPTLQTWNVLVGTQDAERVSTAIRTSAPRHAAS